MRQTKTSIDVLHQATIDDCWDIDGHKSLSELWIGVTRFEELNNSPPEGQRKARNIWAEENPKIGRNESSETFTPCRTTILIMRIS